MTFPSRPPGDAGHPPDPGPPPGVPAAGVVVRLALPHELDDAGAIVRHAYEVDGHVDSGYAAVVGDARGRAGKAEVVVAVDRDGTVLGSVTFAVPPSPLAELSGPGEAEFRMLGVHPGARGRGVGEALVRWCLDRARQLGAHRVVLCTMERMAQAHRLYERLGFRRRPDLDWRPDPEVLLIAYALDL